MPEHPRNVKVNVDGGVHVQVHVNVNVL